MKRWRGPVQAGDRIRIDRKLWKVTSYFEGGMLRLEHRNRANGWNVESLAAGAAGDLALRCPELNPRSCNICDMECVGQQVLAEMRGLV